MLRCVTPAGLVPALSALLAGLVMATAAGAQTMRKFPATALRGELVVTQPPEVLLNRQPARLAPGSRIRGADNMMVLSGALIGHKLIVHYTLDPTGGLLDVWVLTAPELSRRPWPVSTEQAAGWSYDPDSQTWSRP